MARAKSGERPAVRGSYDRFKEYHGQRYTGMAVGRSHHWTYDAGDWTEKKITPDRWTIHYAVKKHRKGRAPEGSGAPVGTSHHWYILADQVVTKLDANTYSTELSGAKFKLAHRRAGSESWNATDRARRKLLVQILRQMIAELEHAEVAAPRAPEAPSPARPAAHTRRARHRPSARRRRSA